MKGIIINILEATVIDAFDEDTWDDMIDAADVDGHYTSLGNYDDAEVIALITALPAETGADLPERLRWFGTMAAPQLASRFPAFFEGHDLRSVLPTLNHVIHPEVRKLYPGANPPVFDVGDGAELVLTYHSDRGLCHLAEGFVLGTAACLGEVITVSQSTCIHRGDATCDIVITWATE